MKIKQTAIALGTATALLAVAPKPAAAFGFGDIAGIVESFAPFLSNVVGETFSNILQNSASFAGALAQGDFQGATQVAMGALGDYGVIGQGELKEEVRLAQLVQYGQGNTPDYGGGVTAAQYQGIDDAQDVTAEAYAASVLGKDAQTRLLKSGEGTANSVQASIGMAKASGKSKVSQVIFKNISAQLAVNAVLAGQQLSESRDHGMVLKQALATLSDLRANQNRYKRLDRSNRNRTVRRSAQSAGLFAGVVGGEEINSSESYATSDPTPGMFASSGGSTTPPRTYIQPNRATSTTSDSADASTEATASTETGQQEETP